MKAVFKALAKSSTKRRPRKHYMWLSESEEKKTQEVPSMETRKIVGDSLHYNRCSQWTFLTKLFSLKEKESQRNIFLKSAVSYLEKN